MGHLKSVGLASNAIPKIAPMKPMSNTIAIPILRAMPETAAPSGKKLLATTRTNPTIPILHKYKNQIRKSMASRLQGDI